MTHRSTVVAVALMVSAALAAGPQPALAKKSAGKLKLKPGDVMVNTEVAVFDHPAGVLPHVLGRAGRSVQHGQRSHGADELPRQLCDIDQGRGVSRR